MPSWLPAVHDVADREVPQRNVRGGRVEGAAVVEVEAVARSDCETRGRRSSRAAASLSWMPLLPPSMMAGFGGIGAANRDLLQIGAVVPAVVDAGLQDDLVAGRRGGEGGRKLRRLRDDALDAKNFTCAL